MSELHLGCALLTRRPAKQPVLYARVIHIDALEDVVVISFFPEKNAAGYQKNYIKKPVFRRLSSLKAQIVEGEFSVVKFETPSHWLLSDEQLRRNSSTDLLGKTRRNLRKWLTHRRDAYRLIRPFVHRRTVDQIILDPAFSGWPAKRAIELGQNSCAKVQRALNAFLLGLGLRNSLLPWYPNSGGPGKEKYSKTKTGRPREFGDSENRLAGINCSEDVRKIFALGWSKYKKPGVSTEVAFHNTLNDWFAASIKWQGSNAVVTLRPEAENYRPAQFEYWGTRATEALTANQIHRGETHVRQEFMRRQGKIKDRHNSMNGTAYLDSTPADQTLVSSASRLKPLSSPRRTEVIGAGFGIDYIFGSHLGFEHASSTTALLAILNAAEDKVLYCAKNGITIEPRDWLSMSFRQFVMDNGEGKNQAVMKSLEEIEVGASYGAAYQSINKAPAESNFNRAHKDLDHLIPGSTMGRRPRRGEPARAELARLNFQEFLPLDIKRILRHNNEEIITLPLVAMRRDGVEPTRRGAVEWLLANGYLSSTAQDLTALKVRCLPRLSGFLAPDGVHLYDPLYTAKRVIPELVYTSEWLLRSGALGMLGGRRKAIELHINPSDLSQCWTNLGGLQLLHLKSGDTDLHHMTLLDWLSITRDDRLVAFLSKAAEQNHGLRRAAEIKQTTSKANAERKAEIKSIGVKPTKSELKRGIRLNTALERSARTGIPKLSKTERTKVIDQGLIASPAPSSANYRSITSSEVDDVMRLLQED
jgi:hypothetical protein